MVICSLDSLKESSNKKETGIEKEIVEVRQESSDRRKKTGKRKIRMMKFLDLPLCLLVRLTLILILVSAQPAWDVSNRSHSPETSQWHLRNISLRRLKYISKRCLFCHVFKTSQIHLKKNVFFVASLRWLKYISKKMFFRWRL